jgi:hypothetical protein
MVLNYKIKCLGSNELEGNLKETVWPNMRQYFGSCLEKLNKSTRRLGITDAKAFLKLNPEESNLEATCSVFFYHLLLLQDILIGFCIKQLSSTKRTVEIITLHNIKIGVMQISCCI